MTVRLSKRIKRSVRSAIARAAIRLLSLLPLGAALALGGAVGRMAYLLAGKTRRLALVHLALAFPERSEAERAAIARGMFVHLGRAAMEVVAIRCYDAKLDTYVELANGEVLREVMARGKGMSEGPDDGPAVGTIRRKGVRRGDGHLLEVVEIRFDPAATDREAEAIRLTAACSYALETAIRRSPEEWVWMHQRWKTRPPVEVAASQQASRMPKTAELSDA